MTNRIMEWLEATVGQDSTNEIARRSGLTVSTVHRQRTSGALSPEVVAAIARAYGANVLDALVAHGVLLGTDIDTARALDGLRDASDEQLTAEIMRRLEGVADGDGGIFDEPNPPVNLNDHRRNDSGSGHAQDEYDKQAAARKRSDDRGEDFS